MFNVGDEVLVRATIKEFIPRDMMYLCELKTGPELCIRFGSPAECIADKTYADGLKDAWAVADKLNNMPLIDIVELFGIDIAREEVFKEISPEEALAKIEAYEREKKIKVGDEVKHDIVERADVFVVTSISKGMIRGVDKNGVTHSFTFPNRYIKKTGKHIDIEGLLRQIGE